MSLASQVTLLATRIGQECKAIRAYCVATFAPIVHGHVLTDANITGILPEARLPTRLQATPTSVLDFNTATSNGWYKGSNPTNGPGPAGDYYLEVLAFAPGLMLQRAYNVSGTAANTLSYQRFGTGVGVFTAWFALELSGTEQAALYAALSHTHVLSDLPDAWVKRSVKAATVANVTLATAAPNTLDGVTLALNDRVLVKNQTSPAQNGIYAVTTLGGGSSGTWTRATDADLSTEVAGATVNIDQGGQGGQIWRTTFRPTDTLGTTVMTWYPVTTTGYQTLEPVRVSSTFANVTLSGPQTVDSIVLNNGDRVLCRGQTAGAATNGIYVVNTGGAWARALDASTAQSMAQGTTVFVTDGVLDRYKVFTQNAVLTTLGTDPVQWRVRTVIDEAPPGFQPPPIGTGHMFWNRAQKALQGWNGAVWESLNGPTVCTSTTRPAGVTSDATIYETDTGNSYVFANSAWKQIGGGGSAPGLEAVKASSGPNIITLSGPQTVDGVACVAGDRVLCRWQAPASGNGIYVVAAGAWARAADANTVAAIQKGTKVAVLNGNTEKYKIFTQVRQLTTLGTDLIEWRPVTSVDVTTAGVGAPAGLGEGHLYWNRGAKALQGWNGSAWEGLNGVTICTSTTRPASPLDEAVIFETDTLNTYIRSGGAWVPFGSGSSVLEWRQAGLPTSYTMGAPETRVPFTQDNGGSGLTLDSFGQMTAATSGTYHVETTVSTIQYTGTAGNYWTIVRVRQIRAGSLVNARESVTEIDAGGWAPVTVFGIFSALAGDLFDVTIQNQATLCQVEVNRSHFAAHRLAGAGPAGPKGDPGSINGLQSVALQNIQNGIVIPTTTTGTSFTLANSGTLVGTANINGYSTVVNGVQADLYIDGSQVGSCVLDANTSTGVYLALSTLPLKQTIFAGTHYAYFRWAGSTSGLARGTLSAVVLP
jgi:hypothetical protein